jgi:hypothetical protein
MALERSTFAKWHNSCFKFANDFKLLAGGTVCIPNGGGRDFSIQRVPAGIEPEIKALPRRGALDPPMGDPVVHRRSGRPDNLIGRGIGPELRTRPPAPFVAAIVAIESDECARGGGRSPRGSLRFSFRPRGMRRRRVYGKRLCPVEVDQHEIDGLVAEGLLPTAERENSAAVGRAIMERIRFERRYEA